MRCSRVAGPTRTTTHATQLVLIISGTLTICHPEPRRRPTDLSHSGGVIGIRRVLPPQRLIRVPDEAGGLFE
jgi:hypothetical protein